MIRGNPSSSRKEQMAALAIAWDVSPSIESSGIKETKWSLSLTVHVGHASRAARIDINW